MKCNDARRHTSTTSTTYCAPVVTCNDGSNHTAHRMHAKVKTWQSRICARTLTNEGDWTAEDALPEPVAGSSK